MDDELWPLPEFDFDSGQYGKWLIHGWFTHDDRIRIISHTTECIVPLLCHEINHWAQYALIPQRERGEIMAGGRNQVNDPLEVAASWGGGPLGGYIRFSYDTGYVEGEFRRKVRWMLATLPVSNTKSVMKHE